MLIPNLVMQKPSNKSKAKEPNTKLAATIKASERR